MLTQEEIKTFVVQNNILGYAIAMIIALTLKDFVATFIVNFIVPAINLFLFQNGQEEFFISLCMPFRFWIRTTSF